MLVIVLLTILSVCYGWSSERVMIPMRDGVLLSTVLVFPDDNAGDRMDHRYGVIMDRSPYGYNVTEWLGDLFIPAGFVGVGQDMRGTFNSQGNYSIWHSDAADAADTIAWLQNQSWSNGQVMSMGASADGMAAMTIPLNENVNELIQGQYIIWAYPGLYAGAFHHGTYMLWFDRWFDRKLDGTYNTARCIRTVRAHETRDDYWLELDLEARYAAIAYPSGHYGGWYDTFLQGTLVGYDAYDRQVDASVRGLSNVVIDPVGHCASAGHMFPQNAVYGRSLIPIAQAYATFGLRPLVRPAIQDVTFYVMSSMDDAGLSVGGYWTSLEKFPEFVHRVYYAHADGGAYEHPPGETADAAQTSTTYTYDPAHPAPTIGGNNLDADFYGDATCGPLDNQEVDARADVISFETPRMVDPLYLTGPLSATLFVGSDAVDTDFMVKITDVYPSGESRILQDNAVRMRWRGEIDGSSPTPGQPVPMEAGAVYLVRMDLWNTSYVVAPNHSLRFSISSSNYPRFSVNRNNGLPLEREQNGRNITAKNTVYHSAQYPTSFSLPVVSREQLPEAHGLRESILEAYPWLGKLEDKYPQGFF